jgi:hypothetical protein
MRNKLFVGVSSKVELPKGGYLFISDDVPEVSRPRVFDPLKHSFNPFADLTYRKAREIADILYTVYPQGENTLTVRNGKRALLKMLMDGPDRLDKLPRDFGKTDLGPLEALATVDDVRVSPVLRRVLCNPTNFSFKPNSKILARLDRAELGEFDCLLLGLLLMAHFKGQVVVKEGGSYLRDMHVSLIRENRVVAGINFLDELPVKLRRAALLIDDKIPNGATLEDAETLAEYAG